MNQFYPGGQSQAQDPRVDQLAGEMQRFAQQIQSSFAGVGMGIRRLENRLAALEVRAALQDAGRKPRGEIRFRSQFNEDVAAWNLLGPQLDGFYVEVGAFDGRSFSVSSVFDVMGWDGLLIEAIPERAEQCRANRPNARVVHAALSKDGSSGTTTFKVADDQFGGMLSFLQADGSHAQGMQKAKIPMRDVTVPLTTMNELLKDHQRAIDLAVIDVEGGELDVLKGFDLRRFKPRVLLLEDNTRGADKALEQYMATQEYTQLGWIEVSRVYVHKEAADVFKRASGQA
jgi:FkbM family methyltransferase